MSGDGAAAPELKTAPAVPMLWRVFAANAAVFALAFALLALSPVEIHARTRLIELVILLVGLLVMLIVDLVLLRQALSPLGRLSRMMSQIDLLRPGQRATGFEHAGREVLALAQAFNEMLERIEGERRDSSGRVLAAQEAERLRIARELHDEVGQTLTAVALRAEHAARSSGARHPEFAQLAQTVHQSLADVRRISLELRPAALDLGLVNALISLCAGTERESGITVHRDLHGPELALPADVELAVYRIAQEALTNVMRHSGASEATVSLRCTADELLLSVTDDGRGLPAHVSEGGGLAGMRERAMLIGADLAMEQVRGGMGPVSRAMGPATGAMGPADSAGLVVTLRLPLPIPAPARPYARTEDA